MDVLMRRGPAAQVAPPPRTAIALASATALVLLVGAWGILARPGSPASHDPTRLEIPGGSLTISQVWPETMAHAMSGMAVPDEVAPGHRRVAVEVTVEATGNESLAFRAREVVLDGSGMPSTRALRAEPDEAVIPAGAGLAARLVFDIPEDAAGLVLRHAGSAGALELELQPHQETEADHESAP